MRRIARSRWEADGQRGICGGVETCHDQAFCSPEEIRKANLCGADLRGARLTGADFYLVDLRGAKYDADQLEHFRRRRAILEDPA